MQGLREEGSRGPWRGGCCPEAPGRHLHGCLASQADALAGDACVTVYLGSPPPPGTLPACASGQLSVPCGSQPTSCACHLLRARPLPAPAETLQREQATVPDGGRS